MSELSLEFTAALKLETYIKHLLPRQKMQMKIWNHIMMEIWLQIWFQKQVFFDSQGANEKKYDGNTTRNMISESGYLPRLCSFTEWGCKAPHFTFLQWNFLSSTYCLNFLNIFVQIIHVFVEIAKCICQNPHQGCVHSQSEDAKRRISHSFNEIFWKRNRPGKYKYML